MPSVIPRALLFLLALSSLQPSTAHGQSRLLVGDVIGTESGTPLAHAMITVLGVERQTFTSDGGVFAFSGLDPGRYRLRATHIGFVPAELIVDIPEAGAMPRVRIALKRFSVELAQVRVTATSACTMPGRPNADLEPDFAAIVGQLRLNAEHYQLLTDSFPFSSKMVRQYREMRGDSVRGPAMIDTVYIRTDGRGWAYKMGEVVEREGPFKPGQQSGYIMHLPTLRDFASYEFLNNHCFRYAGVDTTRDGIFVRINFAADIQIRTPDVNGSILLDAKTYQIHQADLVLTKPLREVPDVTGAKVTTMFSEIAPSITVIHDVFGINSLRHGRGKYAHIANTEDQKMVDFEWLRSDPNRPIQP